MKIRTAEAAEVTHLSSERDFPAIPATSRMIELMEMAAARLMRPRLKEGETSVAVAMNLTYVAHSLHRAASGSMMRAVASTSSATGRLYRFTINAFDESGLIGTAEHTRAILVERRLPGIARERA